MITEQKPFAEIGESLGEAERVYLIGCGTCTTMCATGGKSEVLEMKDRLEEIGKRVTGWMVIPIACDYLTREAVAESAEAMAQAEAMLVMTCALGVQRVAGYTDKPVYPALNTLFFGMEDAPGHYSEVCIQCGDCVLGRTACICPLTACPKELLNGPCGGYSHGMCEVDPNRECAWIEIYNRLKGMDQLEKLSVLQPLKDHSKMTHPRRMSIGQ
ncbi:MAG: methylenetetrahydrofolate reductase C-terminal domain-containing protein [Dehalococcoidia bacterium]